MRGSLAGSFQSPQPVQISSKDASKIATVLFLVNTPFLIFGLSLSYHNWDRFARIRKEARAIDEINVSIPSSRDRATVRRTVALNWFDSSSLLYQQKKPPRRVAFSIGGAEGNRTPVRKQLGKNFSGRSLLFTFPPPGGNKHPPGFSSFIMHGRRKALPAHVLHSNHTRARLVDLPGRMGA